jgi:phage baseplate assembly protein W
MAIRIPNQNPLDINQRVAIGVPIPFNAPAVFFQTYTTSAQIKSNIINYILTNTGERVLNPAFGGNIRAQLFENITTNTLESLEIKIMNDMKRYFPSVKVSKISLTPNYQVNSIQLILTYSVLNDTLETINITL